MELQFIDRVIQDMMMLDILSRGSFDSLQLGWNIGSLEVGFHSQSDIGLIRNLQERQFILSQKTRDRLKGDLKLTLIDGVQNNESIFELKKRINQIFDNMKKSEVERIARTEIITSANQARQEAWMTNPSISYKMWLAKTPYDKRVADDSKRLNGQIQPVGEPFVDWKTGQNVMQPPLRPNDRCTSIPLINLPKETVKWHELQYNAKYLDRNI